MLKQIRARDRRPGGRAGARTRRARCPRDGWPCAATTGPGSWPTVPSRGASSTARAGAGPSSVGPGPRPKRCYLNTLGVVLYRAGRYDEAIATLERSLAAGRGQSDAFDLFFLAMAHHRLGHREEAHTCFDRALRWLGDQQGLSVEYARELALFRTEAEAVLAGPVGELPDDVLAPE